MKKFAGALLGIGLATGVANAQNNPAPKPFADDHGTLPPSMVEFGGDNVQGGVFNSKKYGSGVSGRLVFQNGKCGLVLDSAIAQYDKDFLAAVGCDIVDGDDNKTTLLFGSAWRETDLSRALPDPLIPENTDGKGKQLFVTFVYAGKEHSFAFTARGGEADDTKLYNETRLLSTETATTRQGGYMVTRRTDTLQDYLTTAYGDKWVNAEVRGTFVTGKNSEIVIAFGAEKEWSGKNRENTTTNAIGSLQYKTSFDTNNLILDASRYGNQNSVGAILERSIFDGRAGLRVGASHVDNDTRVSVNIIVPLGGKYTRPQYGKPPSDRTLVNSLSEAADSEGNHVSDLSTRYTVVKEAVGVARRDTKEISRTMVPNSPFTIGTTSCTLIQFVEGNSTTCTLTPTDADGIAAVTATVDGNPVAVNFDGATYSVSLSGLDEGTHTLVWTGTGRKPDGTPEPIAQTTSQTITVTSANHAPVPTFTGMAFDASLNTNVSGQLTATDADTEDNLTYALVTPPSSGNMVVNANGSFTITGAVMPGTYTFTYSVTDGQSAPVSKVAILTVNDVAPICTQNNTITSIEDFAGGVGSRVINTISCTDSLNRSVNYTVEVTSQTGQYQPFTGPVTLTIDTNGNVIFPPVDASGPWSITYEVTATPQGGTQSTEIPGTLDIVDNF